MFYRATLNLYGAQRALRHPLNRPVHSSSTEIPRELRCWTPPWCQGMQPVEGESSYSEPCQAFSGGRCSLSVFYLGRCGTGCLEVVIQSTNVFFRWRKMRQQPLWRQSAPAQLEPSLTLCLDFSDRSFTHGSRARHPSCILGLVHRTDTKGAQTEEGCTDGQANHRWP